MFTPTLANWCAPGRPEPGGHAHSTRVWLNGQEISKCLQAVTLTIGDGAGHPRRADDRGLAHRRRRPDLAALTALVEAQMPAPEEANGH